jgi:peptidoglycan/LPS O-acetylase OafA/YrhL
MRRDPSLDFMRFIGILIIMVAHANPPGWLFNLRNFGTPLLVITSAITYSVIYGKRELLIGQFLKRRLSRLVFPAWIFLTIFFLFFYIASFISDKGYPFPISKILTSYTLYSGIGFVWIFKVYIILAFITPVALYYKDKTSSNFVYFFSIAAVYVLYEITITLTSPLIPTGFRNFFNRVIFVVFPYSLLFIYGLKLADFRNGQLIGISLGSFVLFSILAIYLKYVEGSFVPTQGYKYPPRLYYLAYAFFAVHLVYFFCRISCNWKNNRVIAWLSSNSLWLYLWHILAFYIWDYFSIGSTGGDFLSSFFKASFLLGFGISLTYAQKMLASQVIIKNEKHFFRMITNYFS